MKRTDNPLRKLYEYGGQCPICEQDISTCECDPEDIDNELSEMEDEK